MGERESESSDILALFERFLERESDHDRLQTREILRLLSVLLGDRIQVGDASRYIYTYGRQIGYDLPPYPLAGCGEIREFFADEHVVTLSEWYEKKLGIGYELYAELLGKTMVVVRDVEHRRTPFLLEGIRYKDDTGFVGLEESGLIKKLSLDEQAVVARRILTFLAHGRNDDGFNVF